MSKNKASILIIDDNADVLTSARLFLKQHFSKIIAEPHPRNVNEVLSKEKIDLVLLDMNFTKGDNDGREGIYWLEQIKEISPETQVILMTAYGDVELAVKAIKLGATDFVLKPWKNEKLLSTINTTLKLGESQEKIKKLEGVNRVYQQQDQIKLDNFIGESPAMLEVFKTIEKVGKTDANVLILGENGTGKTLVALALHQASLRQKESFVHVDLGSLNENLFESELFGHKKGSFTDAYEDKTGRFEIAHSGSLFLDEIGNLPVHLQAKLLSVLQNRRYSRLGESKDIEMDVRLICATNMPLYDMIGQKEFRQDLLYRVNTVEITLPPLRERLEDIPVLVSFFIEKFAKKYGKPTSFIRKEGMDLLLNYNWPGNIRELEHTIERLIIMADEPELKVTDLQGRNEEKQEMPANLNLEEMERYLVDRALRKNKGNISKAAIDLGLTRAALYRRMEKHEL